MADKLVELDDRRRVALGKVGRSEDQRYLVREEPDGTLIWRPAVVMDEVEAAFLRNHPEALQQVRENQANSDPSRRRPRPPRRGTGAEAG
jgi:hypothetical protein